MGSKTAAAAQVRPEWGQAHRIVVKIGSALLVDDASGDGLLDNADDDDDAPAAPPDCDCD